MKILKALLIKEFTQFRRNPFLPRVVVMLPLTVMLLLPWITTMDVRNVKVAVVDHDRSSVSHRFIANLNASDYFTLTEITTDYAESERMLENTDVDVIVSIPDEYEKSLLKGNAKRIEVTANAVNALKGSIGSQYVVQTIRSTMVSYQGERADLSKVPAVVIQNRYNQTLNYRSYMIPALMIMLMIMICGFLPALNFVWEKETGTIEQINVTPVNPFLFILAKLLPFWIIGLLVLTLAMIVAGLTYGLWPMGSAGAIYLSAFLFIITISGVGVTVANSASTMQQTMFVMFFIVMVFMMMSGLLTPVSSMPHWAQKISFILPPYYLVDNMRSIYLKGSTMSDLSMHFVALAIFACIASTLAAVTYRKQN